MRSIIPLIMQRTDPSEVPLPFFLALTFGGSYEAKMRPHAAT